jgi:hypothetical protein
VGVRDLLFYLALKLVASTHIVATLRAHIAQVNFLWPSCNKKKKNED